MNNCATWVHNFETLFRRQKMLKTIQREFLVYEDKHRTFYIHIHIYICILYLSFDTGRITGTLRTCNVVWWNKRLITWNRIR